MVHPRNALGYKGKSLRRKISGEINAGKAHTESSREQKGLGKMEIAAKAESGPLLHSP